MISINPLVARRMTGILKLYSQPARGYSTDLFLSCLNDSCGYLNSFHEINVVRCIESCGAQMSVV